MGRSRPRISGPSGFELVTPTLKAQPSVLVRQILDDESCRSGSLHFQSLASPESVTSDTKHAAQLIRQFVQEAGVITENAATQLDRKGARQNQEWNHNKKSRIGGSLYGGDLSRSPRGSGWPIEDSRAYRNLVCDASSSEKSSTDQTIALLGAVGDATLPKRTVDALQRSELSRLNYAMLNLVGPQGNDSLNHRAQRDSISEFSTVLAQIEPRQAHKVRRLLCLYHLKDAQLKLLSANFGQPSKKGDQMQQSLAPELLRLAAERWGDELVAIAAENLEVDPADVRNCLAESSQAAISERRTRSAQEKRSSVYADDGAGEGSLQTTDRISARADVALVTGSAIVKSEAPRRHKATRGKSGNRSKPPNVKSLRSASVATLFAEEIHRLRNEINALEASLTAMTPSSKRARKVKQSARTANSEKRQSPDVPMPSLPPQPGTAAPSSIIQWRPDVSPRRLPRVSSSQHLPRKQQQPDTQVSWIQARSPSCPAVVRPSLSAGITSAASTSCVEYDAPRSTSSTQFMKPDLLPDAFPKATRCSSIQMKNRPQLINAHLSQTRLRPTISQSSQSTVPLINVAATKFSNAATGNAETSCHPTLSCAEPRVKIERKEARPPRGNRVDSSLAALPHRPLHCSVCSSNELTPVHSRNPVVSTSAVGGAVGSVSGHSIAAPPSFTAAIQHFQCASPSLIHPHPTPIRPPSKLALRSPANPSSVCIPCRQPEDRTPEIKERPRPSSLLGAPDPSDPSPVLSQSGASSHSPASQLHATLSTPLPDQALSYRNPPVIDFSAGQFVGSVRPPIATSVPNAKLSLDKDAVSVSVHVAKEPVSPTHSASLRNGTLPVSKTVDDGTTNDIVSVIVLPVSTDPSLASPHPSLLTESLNETDQTTSAIANSVAERVRADPVLLDSSNHQQQPSTIVAPSSEASSSNPALSSRSTTGPHRLAWLSDLPELPSAFSESSSESFGGILRASAAAYWHKVIAPLAAVPPSAVGVDHMTAADKLDELQSEVPLSSQDSRNVLPSNEVWKQAILPASSSLAVDLASQEAGIDSSGTDQTDAGCTPVHGGGSHLPRIRPEGFEVPSEMSTVFCNVMFGESPGVDGLALLPQVLSISAGTSTDGESLPNSTRTSESAAASKVCDPGVNSVIDDGQSSDSQMNEESGFAHVNRILSDLSGDKEPCHVSFRAAMEDTASLGEEPQASVASARTISSEGERLSRHQSLFPTDSGGFSGFDGGSLSFDAAQFLCPTGRSLDGPEILSRRKAGARERCLSAV